MKQLQKYTLLILLAVLLGGCGSKPAIFAQDLTGFIIQDVLFNAIYH